MKKDITIRSLMRITRTTVVIAIAGVMLITTQGCKKEKSITEPLTIPTLNSDNYKNLNTTMRKLWADHMQWTYATVDAFYNNPGALQAHLDRLLQNQQDIGAAIASYYGQAAGDTLASLLTTHITQAPPVLQAAKDNNQAALNAALNDWNANAEDIADFLSAANPGQWEQSHLRTEMKAHITQTTTYAVALLQKDYSKAVTDYETAFGHMMHLADELSVGIAKQFPNKF